jgi:diguanylate cyclase (GGDEF)-like protein
VLYDASRAHADSVGHALVSAVGRLRMPHAATALGTLTISAGAAVDPKPDLASLARLLQRADEALYSAKANGRNTFVLAAAGAGAAL